MFPLLLIAVPVLLVAALMSKARQAAPQREAEAEADALDQLQRAQITQRGNEYHIVVSIDAPASIEFPLSLTLCDARGTIGHFSVTRDGTVTEEVSQ